MAQSKDLIERMPANGVSHRVSTGVFLFGADKTPKLILAGLQVYTQHRQYPVFRVTTDIKCYYILNLVWVVSVDVGYAERAVRLITEADGQRESTLER